MFATKMVIRKVMRLRVKHGYSKVQYQIRHQQSLILSIQLALVFAQYNPLHSNRKNKTHLPLQA
jgi:hypothetical protein